MITVRDIYEARTVRALTRRAARHEGAAGSPYREEASAAQPRADVDAAPDPARRGRPGLATVAQAAWLAVELLVAAPLGYLVAFRVLPWLSDQVGLVALLLLAPLVLAVAATAWTPFAVLLVVTAKRILIGRYVPERVPAWSGRHVRIWFVRQLTRLVPWNGIAGTEFQCIVLRALGARVGRRVHIHRGVDLLGGGWDLLELGDDVTLAQDASLGLIRLEQGHIVVAPVTVQDGATLDVRAGVAGHTRVGRNAVIAALSSLPAGGVVPPGERWDGVPARRVGPAPHPPEPPAAGRRLSPVAHGVAMVAARRLLQTVMAAPFLLASVILVQVLGLTYDTVLAALAHPFRHPGLLAAGVALACLGLIAGVALEAVVARALGPVREGVLSRWSLGYIRVCLKSDLVNSAGRWLSGGLYWPVWLRWAGMTVGPGCEISTIIDVVPELVRIGPGTFFADGIYLGGPWLHRGTVTLRRVEISGNSFLGNHVVVSGGQRLPPDILIGICTVADDRLLRPGTSWFGHPSFELPRREIIEADRAVTHEPAPVRVISRLFWEWLRFALPAGTLLTLAVWVAAVSALEQALPTAVLLGVGIAAATAGTLALMCLFVLAMKWTLLGRVRPGNHPLWSCWCSRWDFLYVAWGFLAGPVLAGLEGTLLLAVYLRAMGMRIGRRVLFGEGFAQVVDPDMLHIEDDATVNAMFQAHTFEDRVLKIGPVRVGAGSTLGEGTVPLYGAEIGRGAYVAAHSVVMKHERLGAGLCYEGVPTVAAGRPR